MKKTLAAVLAAAMALSTATVAFATDTPVDIVTSDKDLVVSTIGGDADKFLVKMGDTTKCDIEVGGLNEYQVGWLLENDYIKIDASVTSGRNNLASAPVVKVATVKGGGNVAQLQFKVAHTYGTKNVEVSMKIRVTLLKPLPEDAETTLELKSNKKGDTLTGDTITFKAAYNEVTAYGEDMTLTKTEVKDNCVLAKGEKLYDNSGDGDKVTFYFDNYAAYTTKVSAAQKDINLYYTVDEIADVTDAYPDVDFEFITFKGTPSFSNRGELTFNAIGGKNTKVYSYANGELTELDGEYDSTYGIVTVDGVKTLGSYVIASEALEVEEEPAAPSTPAVEEENPNTGAC